MSDKFVLPVRRLSQVSFGHEAEQQEPELPQADDLGIVQEEAMQEPEGEREEEQGNGGQDEDDALSEFSDTDYSDSHCSSECDQLERRLSESGKRVARDSDASRSLFGLGKIKKFVADFRF